MTLGISDSQLALMRSQVIELLPDTAVLQEVSLVSDGAGGQVETWQAVTGGTVSCRLDPVTSGKSSEVDINFGKETTSVFYQLTTPYDSPLADNQRVAIDGNTYTVVQLDVEHSWNVSRRAVVVDVR